MQSEHGIKRHPNAFVYSAVWKANFGFREHCISEDNPTGQAALIGTSATLLSGGISSIGLHFVGV